MNKSTKAIAHDMPGVTRDRHYGHFKFDTYDEKVNHFAPEGVLIDTGGFYPEGVEIDDSSNNTDHFFNLMTKHAEMAIDESDLVLMVCDIREGLLPYDESIANYVRSKQKKFFVLLNKFDGSHLEDEVAQFYSLGVEEDQIFPVSASHGLGVDFLRSKINEEALFSVNTKLEDGLAVQRGIIPREKVISKVAIVGSPNAGKSTLLNALVGEERALVSDIAGTTVDPIEAYFDIYFGKEVEEYDPLKFVAKEKIQKATIEDVVDEHLSTEQDTETEDAEEQEVEQEMVKAEGSFWRSVQIIDTAGIRRQSAVKELVESQSVFRALRSISDSEIVIHLVDVVKGIGHQDRRLIDIAIEKGKSVIVCLNKFDLISEDLKDEKKKKEWLLDIRAKIPWLNHCDIILLSAKYKKHLKKLKESIKKTVKIRNKKISTGELNRAIFELVERNSITLGGRGSKRFKVKYASVIKMSPPTILMFANRSQGIPDNYRRYLQNGLRDYFMLDNTPIHLIFRSGEDNKIKQAVSKDTAPQA
jgi:GTPase